MDYTVVFSKRKTVAIHIKEDATIEVRAPLRMSQTLIRRFVQSKEDWIQSHLIRIQAQREAAAAFTLQFGDQVPLCGRRFPVRGVAGGRGGFDGACFYLPQDLSPEQMQPALIPLYRQLAKSILREKVEAYAQSMQVRPTAVKINSARTRWGSCSGKNSLNFSWRLLLGEEALIDYVVVHELAHIREHNHSPAFWQLVERVLPDYRALRKNLKALQEQLQRENWM